MFSCKLLHNQAHAMYIACIQLGKRSDCCRDSIMGTLISTAKQDCHNMQSRAPHGRAQCQGHSEAGHKAGTQARGTRRQGAAGAGIAGHNKAGHNEAGHLGKGPVLGNADKGQPLFEAQGPLWALHNIHKIDVAVPNLLNLQHHSSLLRLSSA